MSKTFDPIEFTHKVTGNGTIGKLITSQEHPAATIELKDGVLTLNSREYIASNPVSQVIAEGVKKGDNLDVTVDLTSRCLLTVTVNKKSAEHQLNWPSYRGEAVSFKQGQKNPEPVKAPLSVEIGNDLAETPAE
ncbi:hypothetical protein S21ZY_126 [Pseudomonas phage ZY21]|nr:hypothetical protein S21ZY_126 [Pseudomonas phage ZY21]